MTRKSTFHLAAPLAACVWLWGGAADAAPILSLEGVPSTYTPGGSFSFTVRLQNATSLSSYSIDLVLAAASGNASADFFFDNAQTVQSPSEYVFDYGDPDVTPFGFFANAGVFGAAATLNLSDFLASPGTVLEVDTAPGVNELIADVVVTTTGNVGPLTLSFDLTFLELLDANGDPIPGFDPQTAPAPIVIAAATTSAVVPEPTSCLLWLVLASLGGTAGARRQPPFGINGFDTHRRGTGKPSSPCAQRLSASTDSTPVARRCPAGRRRGAQRLSASTDSTPLAARSRASRFWCSTPFGINGFDTIPAWRRRLRNVTCSTPFGINGFDTHAQRK